MSEQVPYCSNKLQFEQMPFELKAERRWKGLIYGWSEGLAHLDVDKSIRFFLIETQDLFSFLQTLKRSGDPSFKTFLRSLFFTLFS